MMIKNREVSEGKHMDALVSVVVPTYNRAYIIERAVKSILNQTYSNIEVIIVDDGSTDNTCQVVEELLDSRIRYIKNPKNSGVSHARNLGIAASTGKYIAFQDSDDVWRTDKLEKQMKCMKENDYGMVYCAFEREFQDGAVVYYPPKDMPLEKKQGNILKSLLERNLVSTQTMLVKKEVFEKVGFFNKGMSNLEDYELAVRIAKEYEIGMVDEPLVRLYTMSDSINSNQLESLVNIIYIYLSNKEEMKRFGMFDGMMNGVRYKAREFGVENQIEEIMAQIEKTVK